MLLALLLAGCGGHTHPQPRPSATASICRPLARATVARYAGIQPSDIAQTATRSSAGDPECIFRAAAGGGRLELWLSVYTGPQPYFILERTAVEAAQYFGPKRFETPPQAINGIGLEADWFPDQQQFMTTDAKRLITAKIHWAAAPGRTRRALAIAVARPYLGRNDPGAAHAFP